MTRTPQQPDPNNSEGILLIDKPVGRTSFSLVAGLRKLLGVRTIGHAGTLDPLASGVMILLVGRTYTRLSDRFLGQDKEYLATVHLGIETDSYDAEGVVTAKSDRIPTAEAVREAIEQFQGETQQVPPMFSAKKQKGKKLYELARQGVSIERAPVPVKLDISFVRYEYPQIELRVACSKGTYIRSLAHDLGRTLGCGAHLCALCRTRSGPFLLEQCIDGSQLGALPLDHMLQTHTRLALELGGIAL